MKTYLNALGVMCSLGAGKAAVAESLFAGNDGSIRSQQGWIPHHAPPLAAVPFELPAIPDVLAATRNNRNNRLLLAAVQEIDGDIKAAIARYGRARIGIVLGTSTSGIEEATQGVAGYQRDGEWPPDYRYEHQEMGAPAAFSCRMARCERSVLHHLHRVHVERARFA